jgi:two-component system, NarL family, invasion response regulator UvrY
MYTLAIADDHAMLRKALVTALQGFGYGIVAEAANGRELIEKLSAPGFSEPDLVLLDIVMPEKNGFDVCTWLSNNRPHTKVIVVSMNDDEESILRMMKAGARGFVSKEEEPVILKRAIEDVMKKGYYFSKSVSGKMVHDLEQNGNLGLPETISLSGREMEFLLYNCSEYTYKEIARKMFVSPRTVENYRDTLYQKLDVKTRLGLAVVSIKKGWVKI